MRSAASAGPDGGGAWDPAAGRGEPASGTGEPAPDVPEDAADAADAQENLALAPLLCGAIADGVMLLAITAAGLVALLGQSEPVERDGYYLAILVIVPLSVVLAWRRKRAGATEGRRQFQALATLAATAAVLCAVYLFTTPASGGAGTSLTLLLALVAARVAVALGACFVPEAWTRRPARAAVAAMPLLLAAAAAPFVPPATRSLPDVAVATIAGLATFALARAYGGRRGLPRAWRRALDLAVVVGCVLVVGYVARPSSTLIGNQNYFLGPALDILHGHPMLLSTFSQYGVGVMDALAAVFLVVPMGYGTFTLLLSALTTLVFVGLYVVLRWSTGSLPIAACGVAVAALLDVFGQIEFYICYPSTGVLRFGLPWLVVLFSLAAVRTPRHRRLFDALVLAVLAIAAMWSGETGVYCLGTAVVLAWLDAAVAQASWRERLRIGAGRTVLLVAASVFGLVAFTVVTRVAAGVWPDWGGYLEYVRRYTVGEVADLPIEPWSAGLALGGMYVASAIAVVVLVAARPALVRERAVAFRAAAGLTALGTLVYTYYLGRSAQNNLIHVSPPAVALLFVWLGIVRSTFNNRTAAAVASATVVFLGAMIVASEREDISQKYSTTALAALTGEGPPLGRALRTMWDNQLLEPEAERVVRFVRSLPGPNTSLALLITPYLATEALIRLGRANAVGSSNSCQESISYRGAERAARAVQSLRPGAIIVFSESLQEGNKAPPVDHYAFSLLTTHFKLRQIAADGRGLVALRIVARVPAPASPVAILPSLVPEGCS